MRRQDIVRGIENITRAFEASKLSQLGKTLVDDMRKSSKDNDASNKNLSLVFASMKTYFLMEQNFGDVEYRILDILDLSGLSSTEYWQELAGSDERTRLRYNFYTSVNFAMRQLVMFKEIVKQETTEVVQQYRDDATSPFFGKDVISVIIIEEDEIYSKPERLSHVLDSVALFYEVCAVMNNAPNHELSVIACDSGSDKSFDFLGAAKIIECIKEVILSLWDRVIFYRERQLTTRLELVTQALPIIEQISDLEASKKIPPEQAEMLRRKVVDGASKFISSGAVIPEIELSTSFRPRELMAPAKNYLMPPSNGVPAGAEGPSRQASSEKEVEGLTSEEQAQLFKLLKKAREAGEDESNDRTSPED